MPDKMPWDMPDRMPEGMPDRMPEDIPDRMPEDMPDRMPEGMPNRMPDKMPDRMPEDLPVRKCINVMVGITRSKVISFVCSFMTEKCQKWKIMRKNVCVFKEIIYVLQGGSWCDVLRKNLRFFALWWHFGSQSLVWSLVVRFHFHFSAHPCRLQPLVLWPARPSVIERSTQWWQEWILSCVHVWSGLFIACPYPCWIVLTLFWWIDEVHCYTWPKTTLVPDVPFLSIVVRRLAPRGQRCQNKISFDRLQPEQIKQD